MNTTAQIAKHVRDVHFGGNWTSVNMKESLAGVTWEMATTKVYSFHTIAILVYHINYYVLAITKVLKGGPLDSKDIYSFDCPAIVSEEDWQQLIDKTFADAEALAILIEQLPDSKLDEAFADVKYGTYYRNLHGLIEHTHYHLGQIVLIKKMVTQTVIE